MDGRTEADGAVLGVCVHSVIYNASAVTRGAGHMLSEKVATDPKWYYVDLD